MTLNFSWLFWAFLSALFAALTTIFAKVGVQGIDSDMATLVRTGIVFIVLMLLILMTHKWINLASISRTTWLYLSLSAICTGASWLCFYRALQMGDASKVIVVDKSSLVFVMIFATLFLGEKTGLKDWVGAMMVSGGMILMILKF